MARNEMGDRFMTPERIEEIKALCKTDPRALLNGSEALALEVLPVLLAEVERLERDCVDFRMVTKAINEACTCGGVGPGEGCPACNVWQTILIERSKPE
jgi:hypothetical protein